MGHLLTGNAGCGAPTSDSSTLASQRIATSASSAPRRARHENVALIPQGIPERFMPVASACHGGGLSVGHGAVIADGPVLDRAGWDVLVDTVCTEGVAVEGECEVARVDHAPAFVLSGAGLERGVHLAADQHEARALRRLQRVARRPHGFDFTSLRRVDLSSPARAGQVSGAPNWSVNELDGGSDSVGAAAGRSHVHNGTSVRN